MRTIIALIWLLAVPVFLLAQPAPDTLWTRVIGGSGDDVPREIRQTLDGGYIIAGKTNSFGASGYDVFLVKLDSAGDTEWQRTYGGLRGDRCFDVRERMDGGFIAACAFRTPDDTLDKICVLRTNAFGDSERVDICRLDCSQMTGGLIETPDGGVLLTAASDSLDNEWVYLQSRSLIRLESNGNIRWIHIGHGSIYRPITEGTISTFIDIEPGQNGISFITGDVHQYHAVPFHPSSHYYRTECYRYDVGTDTPQQVSSVEWATGKRISSIPDGGILVLTSNAVNRLNGLGVQEWWHQVPSSAIDICSGAMNGYILAGNVSGQGTDIELSGYDSTGALRWQRRYGGSGSDGVVAVRRSRDESLVVLGSTTSFGAVGTDIYIVKTGPEELPSGWAELIYPGPPAWGYRIHWNHGFTAPMTFGNCCPGTSARLSGAAANNWRASVFADGQGVKQTFRPTELGLIESVVDTFWLNHPSCAGQIEWTTTADSGTVAGPLTASSPLNIQRAAATDSDSGVVVTLSTISEPHAWTLQLWRSISDTLNYQLIATLSARGNATHGADYRWVDPEASPGRTNWYYWASRDSLYWDQSYPAYRMRVDRDTVRIRIFSAAVESNIVTANLVTAYETQIMRYVLMRRADDETAHRAITSCRSMGEANHAHYYTFYDSSVVRGHIYNYFVRTVNFANVKHDFLESAVEVDFTIPLEYSLSAYPNPFNAETRVVFTLPERVHATVDVFNLDGQKVATLTDGDWDLGRHEVVLDGSNLASGIYLVHLRTANYSATHKLVLLK